LAMHPDRQSNHLIGQRGFGEHWLIPPRLSACVLRGSPRETLIWCSRGWPEAQGIGMAGMAMGRPRKQVSVVSCQRGYRPARARSGWASAGGSWGFRGRRGPWGEYDRPGDGNGREAGAVAEMIGRAVPSPYPWSAPQPKPARGGGGMGGCIPAT
jgi:hypothetical protein